MCPGLRETLELQLLHAMQTFDVGPDIGRCYFCSFFDLCLLCLKCVPVALLIDVVVVYIYR